MLFLLLHVYSSTNGDAYRRGFPDSTALSVMHLSPLGSQVSFTTVNTTRIENVADWEAISKKYRALVGHDSEDGGSMKDSVYFGFFKAHPIYRFIDPLVTPGSRFPHSPLVYTTTPTPLLPVLNISVCSLFW